MSFVVSGIPPGRSTKGTRHGPENRRLRPQLGEARKAIEEAIWTYNHRRLHESLGYKTPAAFRAAWRKSA